VTALADGGFVLTWQSLEEDGSSWGIYARRYDSNGVEVGEHFRVNTSTIGSQEVASVTALSDGGFLVAWTSSGGLLSGTQVYGQRFGSDGVAVGSEFRINSSIAGDHYDVAVSGLSGGGFLAAWAVEGRDGSSDVYGQRYQADGAAVGGEFRINTYTTGDQYQPALATMANGGFVVTWSSSVQDGDGPGVYGQRFASDGTPVGTEFRANNSGVGQQGYSAPAPLLDGGFVITWTVSGQVGDNEEIFGQRYAANGDPAGTEFQINTYTKDSQICPSVTGLSDGGFVVTWSSRGQDGSRYGVYGQRFTADAVPAGGEFRVNGITDGDQVAESYNGSQTLATLSNGRLVQVWSGRGTEEVFFTLIDVPAPVFTSGTTGSIPENTPTSVVAYDADASSDGPITYSLSGTDSNLFAIDPVNGQVRFLASPNFEAPADKGANNVYDIVVHARDGLIETTRAVAITVTNVSAAVGMTPVPLAGDVQANSYTPGVQAEAAVTSLSDGGFVATWTSSDGNLAGISGRRYAEDGTAVGSEYKVNTYTTSEQTHSSVTSLSGGGFVVTWSSRFQDGSGYGVYGQRYAEDGKAVGNEFKVNTTTTGDQFYSPAAALSDGGFVVTWISADQDGSGYGIYGQRYAANGSPVGGEFKVNTETGSDQRYSSVTSMPDGGFLVTWNSLLQDGNGSGVYGQRYAADGKSVGGEFRLNQITAGDQGNVTLYGSERVTSLNDGHFVQVWSGTGTTEVFFRRVELPWGDDNTPPSITSGGGQGTASLSIAENTKGVTTVIADDTDYGQTLTYGLAGGADAAAFAIDGASGALSFVAAPDFEAPADSNKDNVYEVMVKASDGAGGADSQAIRVTVTDVNTAPTITSGAAGKVAENAPVATVVYEAAGKDDGENHGTLTYSLASVGDSKLFDIDAGTGQVTFKAPADFEKSGDADGNNVYEITVQASDGSLAASQAVSITVTDQNDMAPVITTQAALSVAENTLVVAALTSTDADTVGTAPAVFLVSGGPDAALFDVAAGNLVFKKAADFETDPHSYQVEVTARDGVNHSARLLTITLTDQNDVAPTITTEAAWPVVENTLVAAALASIDVDTVGAQPLFSVSGGADAGLFGIADSNLVFKTAPDFETDPHSYQVEVTASDGVNHSTKQLTITLTDQNDVAPVITTELDLSVAENTLVVAALTSTDPDAEGTNPAEFSITGGIDAALFDVAADNLVFKKAPDFETDPHSYQVEVTASDGVNYSTELLTITLTDQNDSAPVITTEAALSVAENALLVAALTSTDIDTVGNAPVKFSVSGGADAGLFDVAGSNLVFKKAPDFETDPHSYQVEVTASDGVNHSAKLLTVTLTDFLGDNNTVPSITSDGGQGTASLSVAENTTGVTTVVGHDTDYGQTLTYSLAGGADAVAFAIDAASGALSFVAAPDFEAPADANKDNVYEVVVKVSDGAGGIDSQALGITVTNANTAPTITSGATGKVAENAPVATVVYDAEARDDGENSGALTYSLAAGGDSKLFDIDAGTGQVTFRSSPDFEKPGDADGNNVYQITVQASDGSLAASQAVSITVTDQNDVAPVITTEAALSVPEGTKPVVSLTSTDPDTVGANPVFYSISGGADGALFEIVDGSLEFAAGRDYETEAHSYQVEVTASDGVNESAKVLTVTLTDQNDTAPVITTEAALSVAEGKLVVAALTSTDVDTVGTAPAEFSVTGGADAGSFDVAGDNLVFKKAADFETDPHSYEVEVTASDGVNHSAKLLTVTLTDQNDVAPEITTEAALSVAENTLVVAALTSTDADTVGNNPAEFSITGGPDAAIFDVVGGNLVFKKAADFETDPHSYQVEVTARDGVNHGTELLTVTLTDLDDVIKAGDVGGRFDHLGALKDAYIVLQGTPQLSINAQSGVLFNDQQMSAGTAGLVTGPGHGSVELNSDGSFVYLPSDNFAGLDSFAYQATSTGGAVDSAKALVYVVPVLVGPTTTTLDLLSLSREQQLAATYVSFLGRGADRDGFDFWVQQFVAHETTANPADLLAGISGSFGVSDEAKSVYSFLVNPHGASDTQIVSFLDSVYLNLFNRTTDDEGRAYWSNEIKETLAAGGPVGSVLMNIVGGAQNTASGLDITTLMSKVAVNLEYVHAQQEVGNAWTLADDRAQAVGLLDPVAADPQSVLIGVVNAYDFVAAHLF